MLIAPPAEAAPAPVVYAAATFQFMVDAPLARAAPLFGPEGERAWAGPDWDPRYLHPAVPADVQGAVFTIAHGGVQSVWVATRFDLGAGRMQYVVFTPGVMTTTIDVTLTSDGARTRAKVSYVRTALTAEAGPNVQARSRADAASAEAWSTAIAAALRPHRTSRPEAKR